MRREGWIAAAGVCAAVLAVCLMLGPLMPQSVTGDAASAADMGVVLLDSPMGPCVMAVQDGSMAQRAGIRGG